jgi:hypothetical protein
MTSTVATMVSDKEFNNHGAIDELLVLCVPRSALVLSNGSIDSYLTKFSSALSPKSTMPSFTSLSNYWHHPISLGTLYYPHGLGTKGVTSLIEDGASPEFVAEKLNHFF